MKKFLSILMFAQTILAVSFVLAQVGVPAAAPAPAQTAPAQTAPAQAAPAQAAPATPQFAEFQQRFAAYKTTAAKIQELQQEFEKAAQANDKTKIQEIQQAAGPLLKEAETSFMNTVPVALEAYKNSDGKNEELVQFMLVYANYLLTVDNYDQAYQLFASFLSKGMHKKHPEIFEMAGISAFGSNRFAAAKKCFDFAKQANAPLSRQAQAYAESITEYYEKAWMLETQLRQQETRANDLPRVLIRTTVGDIVVELFENEAPNSVKSFITLVEKGYYSNLPFHRVLPGFMAQGGCPKGDGTGGPGYTIPEEYTKENARKHFCGSLAMARSMDPNSAGSQFYITFLPNQSLDSNYTVFGRVIQGLDVLPKIERIDPQNPYAGQIPTKIIGMQVIRKRPTTNYADFQSSPDR